MDEIAGAVVKGGMNGRDMHLLRLGKYGIGVLVVAELFAACSAPADRVTVDLIAVRPRCPESSSDDFFFTPQMFGTRNPMHDERRRYALALSAAAEPSLSCGNDRSEAYRAVGFESIAPVTVVVRIDAATTGLAGEVVATYLERYTDGGERFRVSKRTRRPVSEKEWTQVKEGLARLEYWSIPTFSVRPDEVQATAMDGTSWLWEARHDKRYHAVVRAEQQMGPEFIEVLQTLLRTAGITRP